MNPAAKVLIIDDEVAIRRLLRVAVERSGYTAVEASDARSALNALEIDKPDLVLLDLGLPQRDGLEIVPAIKKAGAALIVISARDATDQKVAALDLGADDYISKPFDTEEVLARARTALRHRLAAIAGESVIRVRDVEIDLAARIVRKAGAEVHLTRKEYGLLAELAKHSGKVLTHAHLLRAVWGPAQEHHIEYLRVAAGAVRRKIDDPNTPTLIRNEPAVGYRLRSDDQDRVV